MWAAAWAVASLLWWGADAPPIDHRGPRAPVVVGYSNALWRLGWRYEHGRGAIRNMPEALRCYSKSAGLGNVEAAARIDSRGPEPAPVLPLQGEDGPLDVTD